jgi:hypothetical protein
LPGMGAGLAVLAASAGVAIAGPGARPGVSRLGRGAETPVLGVDARGNQTVAWTEQRGTGYGQSFSVITATRRAGERHWSRPTRISDVSQDPLSPALAVNASGAAVVAWIEVIPKPSGFVSVIMARTRPAASSRWGGVVRVARFGGSVEGLQLGIDTHGDVTAVWSDHGTASSPVMSATGTSATGRWHRARRVGQLGVGALLPQLAVDGRGDAVVVWQRGIRRTGQGPAFTIHYSEKARYRTAGGPWGRTFTLGRLSEPEYVGANIWSPPTPNLTLDDQGDVTVMWQTIRRIGSALLVAHRDAAAGRWSHPHLLTVNASAPVIGSDARGDVTVAWTAKHGRVFVARSRNGFSWSHPATVPHTADVPILWLSVGQRGNAILTWYSSPATIFVSVRRRAAGRWTRPTIIGHGVFPQAALARTGSAAIIWLQLRRPQLIDVIDAATYPAR